MEIFAITLIITGLIFRALAIFTLGRYWSNSVKEPPVLVSNGIYRFIRHPAYLGSVLIFGGVIILSTKVAIVMLVSIFFYARIVQEEYLMSEKFTNFEEYRKKTGMFLPKLTNFKKKGVAYDGSNNQNSSTG